MKKSRIRLCFLSAENTARSQSLAAKVQTPTRKPAIVTQNCKHKLGFSEKERPSVNVILTKKDD